MAYENVSTEKLGNLTVLNEHREQVKIATLWREKTAVLVFVRHSGCVFCRQQVADLAQNTERFSEHNTNVAVIGSGDPDHFPEFREKTGYHGLLFSDPSLKAFSALGFSNGLKGFVSIGAVFKAASALRQGHRQGSIQGSTLQLGGAIVIDTSGAVRYFFSAEKAGDHPEADELLRSLGHEY